MTCDVIIPAFNNAAVLPETLAALLAEHIPPGWQCYLIISDDGSTDNTLPIAQNTPTPAGWQKKIITGNHAGPGAARNRALDVATAEIIFFLGADIILRPGVLAQHLKFHEQHPEQFAAALGMVRWNPRLPPTPLMEWMTHGGQQNDFDSVLGKTTADPKKYFYASHLSLKHSLIQNLRFPEIPGYGWEDMMFGRTMAQRGLTLHVLPQAIGLHHHVSAVDHITQRQQAVGRNLDYQFVPPRSFWNHIRRALFVYCGGQIFLTWFLVKCSGRYSLPRLFLVFTSNEFWRGVWTSQGGLLPFLRKYFRFSL